MAEWFVLKIKDKIIFVGGVGCLYKMAFSDVCVYNVEFMHK